MLNKRLKVLFLSRSYPYFGGVQRWLSDLYFNLPRYKIDVIVALARGDRYNDPEQYATYYPGMQFIEINGQSGTRHGRIKAVEKIIRKIRPDVVAPVFLYDALIGAVYRRSKGQNFHIVYKIHQEAAGEIEIAINFAKYIDCFICGNKLLADSVIKIAQVSPKRVRLIRFSAKYVQISQFKQPSTPVKLGYCGRLEPSDDKRIFDLVPLCEELVRTQQPFHLKIAGDGTAANKLIQALNQVKAQNRIEYLGFLSQEDLYSRFYTDIDMLLLTSANETGPIVAWEAMMHGVVLISSRYRGSIREQLLKHADNAMLYNTGDMIAAAELINQLTTDIQLYKSVSQNGLRLAQKYLTVKYMVKRWANLLHHLKDRKPLQPDLLSLPKVEYDSRLERFGLPIGAAAFIRKIMGKHKQHDSAYCEWPFYPHVESAKRIEILQQIKQLELTFEKKLSSIHYQPKR